MVGSDHDTVWPGTEAVRRHRDGTALILLDAHLSDWDLICAIKSNYPYAQIIAQQRCEEISNAIR